MVEFKEVPTVVVNKTNRFNDIVNYLLEPKGLSENLVPLILEYNNITPGTSIEVATAMKWLSYTNKAKNSAMHIQIRFTSGQEMTNVELRKYIEAVLNDFDIKRNNHQFIVVQRLNKKETELHILCNRVGLDNTLLYIKTNGQFKNYRAIKEFMGSEEFLKYKRVVNEIKS